MVTRDTPWPEGTPCWVDLAVDDIDKAVNFYSGLFGWQIERGGADVGGYSLALVNGKQAAGIGPKMQPGTPTAWTVYLATENVDQAADKIAASGGEVRMPPMDVMDLGRMAIAADPDGGVFGLWQAGRHTGCQIANETGAITWNENMSRAYDRNREFYSSVFGYHFGDIQGGGIRYATLDLPHGMVGGIGELPEGVPADVPAHWMNYFSVANTDQAVAKVRDLGGQVVQEPWDTPYGRMALVHDDQQAYFSVIQPPAR